MIMERQIRALQSRFPALLETKAWAQRRYRLARKRPFEPEFHALDGMPVGVDEVIVDAGANRGQSIDAIGMFQPDTMIHAFEPNPLLAERLAVMFEGKKSLTLHRFGLGDADSDQPLFVPYYHGFMYDGLASFDRAEASSWLSADTVAGYDPSRLELRETTCSIRKLDDFGLKVAFLKLDVQGFEKHLLQGGAATLLASRPLILMERSLAAEAYLQELGWQHASWRDGVLHPGVHGGTNNLWHHPDRPDRVAHLKFA
jgi:FkbM family methyltransferase